MTKAFDPPLRGENFSLGCLPRISSWAIFALSLREEAYCLLRKSSHLKLMLAKLISHSLLLCNIEFVEADADRRSQHGLWKSILRALDNFGGGFFARFIG
jgi:hypothetical protein